MRQKLRASQTSSSHLSEAEVMCCLELRPFQELQHEQIKHSSSSSSVHVGRYMCIIWNVFFFSNPLFSLTQRVYVMFASLVWL